MTIKLIHIKQIILIVFILIVVSDCYTQQEKYLEYLNGRFGFTFQYPESFTLLESPTNGDGREFISSDRRFYLVAYGSNENYFEYEDINTKYEVDLLKYEEITYKKLFGNYYIISGIDKGEIFYLKKYVGKICTNVIEMKYPKSYKTDYDDIVSIISQSFKPGNLDEFQ